MRRAAVLFFGLALMVTVRAEDWTTEDGKTYKNVTVLNQEDDGVRITYTGGVGKIPFYELPVDIQKRFGQDIESMAAKKKAVDQALQDAVNNAIAAEQMQQPKEGAPAQVNHPPAPVPPPPVPANGSPDASATSSGGGSMQPNGTPTALPNGTPANPTTMTTTPGAPQNPARAAPGTAAEGGKPAGPAHGGGSGATSQGISGLNDYAPGSGGTAPAEAPYPGSKVTYNEALDLCYLDSPAIDLIPVSPPPGAKTNASLTLRVVSEGNKPEAPEKIEATYLCVGNPGQINLNSDISFSVDDKTIAIDSSAKKDSSSMGGAGQQLFYLTFYLTPDQLRTIAGGKAVGLNVSPMDYKFDAYGKSNLEAYQKDIDLLPKSTSSWIRSYYKMLAKIPSFVSILSTACEYLILGSFALLVCASIAAFIMGVTRFIKM